MVVVRDPRMHPVAARWSLLDQACVYAHSGQGPVVPLDLAVGLRPVGPGALVTAATRAQRHREGSGSAAQLSLSTSAYPADPVATEEPPPGPRTRRRCCPARSAAPRCRSAGNGRPGPSARRTSASSDDDRTCGLRLGALPCDSLLRSQRVGPLGARAGARLAPQRSNPQATRQQRVPGLRAPFDETAGSPCGAAHGAPIERGRRLDGLERHRRLGRGLTGWMNSEWRHHEQRLVGLASRSIQPIAERLEFVATAPVGRGATRTSALWGRRRLGRRTYLAWSFGRYPPGRSRWMLSARRRSRGAEPQKIIFLMSDPSRLHHRGIFGEERGPDPSDPALKRDAERDFQELVPIGPTTGGQDRGYLGPAAPLNVTQRRTSSAPKSPIGRSTGRLMQPAHGQ